MKQDFSMGVLYYVPESKHYFLKRPASKIFCSVCQNELDDGPIVIHRSWWSSCSKDVVHTRCSEGIAKNPLSRFHKVDEYFMAYITDVKPSNSIMVLDTPPQLASGHLSLFDIAEFEKSHPEPHKTVDKTRLSGRPEGTWAGVGLGNDAKVKAIEQSTKSADDDPDLLLSARPIDSKQFEQIACRNDTERKDKKLIETEKPYY